MVKVIQTSQGVKTKWKVFYLEETPSLDNLFLPLLEVDSRKTYQTMIGFGGAFTEAACYTIMSAPLDIKEKIMKMYFTEEGLNYNLGRMSIHSCDFSLNSYTYINEEKKNLDEFDISREEQYVIPIIKEAQSIAKKDLLLMATPWSSPAFMKTNQSMLHGGSLLPEYRSMWANYITNFLLEMQKRNINISLLSIQNEPEAVQTWESCLMSAKEEGEFISDYLYPFLEEANLEDLKLLIWDHNRDHIIERAKETFSNTKAFDLVWGIGYHWYVSDEHENLTTVHNLFPSKHLLFTEGCVELANKLIQKNNSPTSLWEHGQRYARHMINDFNNYCEGWIDWNLVLNEIGGPNHVHNYCEAPLMFDRNKQELIINPSYYFIGHFSRYVNPGAKRILCRLKENINCLATAFINPNGDIVTVISNEKEERKIALKILNHYITLNLPSRSITTIILKNK